MLKWALFLCIFLAFVGLVYSDRGPVTLGPGVKAPDEPIQKEITRRDSFTHRDCELTPLASYSLQAKILSRRHYKHGSGSDVCPFDFALGWGTMSDESMLKDIGIRQSSRFYFWSVASRDGPISRSEIIKSSANVHLIPASDMVASTLKKMREGQIVYLEGKLVEVKSPDGWNAKSSLTRKDTGAGACEVLYVEMAVGM